MIRGNLTVPKVIYYCYIAESLPILFKQKEEIKALHTLINQWCEKAEWGSKFPLFMHKLYFYKLTMEEMHQFYQEVFALEKAILNVKDKFEAVKWSDDERAFVPIAEGEEGYYTKELKRSLWYFNDATKYIIELKEGKKIDPLASKKHQPDYDLLYIQKKGILDIENRKVHWKLNYPGDPKAYAPTQHELITLAQQGDVNRVDDDNMNALHYAVLFNDETVVKELLEKGVNPHQENCFGTTPIMMAQHLGYNNVLALMPNTQTGLLDKAKGWFR
jgi:hypothetical protein